MNIFNSAIEAHEEWKRQLIKHVQEDVKQNVEEISNCHACELGQWIDGEGSRYGNSPSFKIMRTAHQEFHREAAEIMACSNAGEKAKALELLKQGGKYAQSSAKLVKALMECGRKLADHVAKGIRSRDKISDI